MIPVNVAELSNQALDYAVALCEGLQIQSDPMGFLKDAPHSEQAGFWVWEDGLRGRKWLIGATGNVGYSPSSDWVHGGEIINRKRIALTPPDESDPHWTASHVTREVYSGNTPLIAAMRAYVASIYGTRIDVPNRLGC